ncbi:hypothetical protein IMCC14465_03050 [alpha proteobacterium IMCC14465]|uniref:Glutamine-dependent NAD(+) synthetase n=1 Tax=alpha proteobacterium IMCC14465 TaxID=1220535 RepID=J9DJ03_9PROT|nr:hypothetical protein IMCC14465_03050 [alpha proteobacterium IMCC14465]
MEEKISITLAQLNPKVGDVSGNADLLRAARAEAAEAGSDFVVAGELFLCGYPPEDLVMKRAFVDYIKATADDLVAETADGGPAYIFGLPYEEDGALYNSVMVAENGRAHIRHKVHLPNYSVFDEKRLFSAGSLPAPVTVSTSLGELKIGLPICEDIWFEDVCAHLKSCGAQILISPNGSPYETGKAEKRRAHAVERCHATQLPLVYVNQLGGQDELVFDGASFVMSAAGDVQVQLPAWQEDISHTTWSLTSGTATCLSDQKTALEDGLAATYQAAMLGLRDYVRKNGFPSVLLGLSGGIDSAICAALAADALGPQSVHCIMLPSKFTSQESLDDAKECAELLGVQLDEVSIEEGVGSLEGALSPLFGDLPNDITEENIQSRLRGTLLMALSNKFGSMVVTTGNKSEVSVGYSTLYGDMNGGFNPIKDIYKTEIFALCAWRNAHFPVGALGQKGKVIPVSIIEKPPTAELRDNQKDEDSLPPYDELDDILSGLVEEELGFDDIVARGHDPDTVKRIEHLLYISEYKRRQAAPGVKIGHRNFGRDRRYPITNGFRNARLKG